MVKRVPSLLFILLFAINVLGNPVDMDQASRVARNFFYERASLDRGIKYHDLAITSTFVKTNDSYPLYFVFNFNDLGFVIVSGDDALTPVIGYSFESNYTDENMPVQFNEWMKNVKDQVVYHHERKSVGTPEIKSDWERLSASDISLLNNYKGSKTVEPLLMTTWDQGAFYNELCPLDADGPGGRVWAGCVATAMAQVMFYYRYPETGNGFHGYSSNYGYLSANFGTTTYQWDQMLTSIHTTNLAIATLIYHCGIAVNMGYSPSGSGAYSGTAANAMINYFRYSPQTHMEDKDNYPNANDWNNLLRSQLDQNKPMYYHGFGTGGHAFNVDGYQPGDYFHFNWGWSGSYNGYFYLNNLNPGGNDFTEGQGAMINIYPADNYPSYCTGSKTYTSLVGTIDDGSSSLLYQGNSDCYYLIDPQVTSDDSISMIRLSFIKLDTESDQDTLTIYDGATTASPILGIFSGNTLPAFLTSSSNKVLLHFTTNTNNNHDGFLLSYESKLPNYCPGLATYRTITGTLQDGSGLKHYNNRSICQYLIQPSTAGKVVLTFDQFKTEAVNDFVEVYALDTLTQQGQLLGHFSGNSLPPALTSLTGAMFVIFFTNSSVNDDGWQATYAVVPVGTFDNDDKQTVSLFPNPASGSFVLSINRSETARVELEMINTTGQMVLKQDLGLVRGNVTTTINTMGLNRGLYFVRIVSPTGVVIEKMMID